MVGCREGRFFLDGMVSLCVELLEKETGRIFLGCVKSAQEGVMG